MKEKTGVRKLFEHGSKSIGRAELQHRSKCGESSRARTKANCKTEANVRLGLNGKVLRGNRKLPVDTCVAASINRCSHIL